VFLGHGRVGKVAELLPLTHNRGDRLRPAVPGGGGDGSRLTRGERR